MVERKHVIIDEDFTPIYTYDGHDMKVFDASLQPVIAGNYRTTMKK